MLRVFSSGETYKAGERQERKEKGLNKDVVSGKLQPWPGPGRPWGLHCTTGLASLKPGDRAAVLLPLPAIGCGLFPFERTFLDEAALPSERKLSRGGGGREPGAANSPSWRQGPLVCFGALGGAPQHHCQWETLSDISKLGAPPSTAQQTGPAGSHLPGAALLLCVFSPSRSFHLLGTGDGLGFLWVQEGRVYVCVPGRTF